VWGGDTKENRMRNRINELRTRAGLTLHQLAARANSDASTISKLERGKTRLTTHWMERLARALNVSPLELVSDTGVDLRTEGPPGPDVSPAQAEPVSDPRNSRWIVLTPVLDELGILPGFVLETAPASIEDLTTHDVCVVEIQSQPAEEPTFLLRLFVEPSLLCTNSRRDNAIPINTRSSHVRIAGVVTSVLRRRPQST
jgi:transcriptional regulator with XRE-family HTH domain